jgi:hypothetical protein
MSASDGATKAPPKPAAKDPASSEEKPKATAEAPDAEETPAETPAVTELDPILPEVSAGGTVIVAESDVNPEYRNGEPGVECKIRPVKIRQLLQIGRVLTGSTRPLDVYSILAPIMEARTEEQREASMIAAFAQLVITVPHSEHEFVNLVNTLLNPITKLTDEEEAKLLTYMDNPEAEDVIRVFHQAYANEAPRMQQLGKALMKLFPTQKDEETPNTESA